MGDLTLTYMGIFGILLLVVMSIVSNSGEQSLQEIEYQMYLFNCPDPIYQGTIDTQNAIIDGFVLTNYTITQSEVQSGFFGYSTFNGTQFQCNRDSITGAYGANIIIKEYGATVTNFPVGWFGYAGDWLSNGLQKVQVFFTLIAFVLTPANFSILGYTLEDLGGIAVMFIVGLYAVAYIFLGAWIYKTVSPFAGGGG